MPADAARRFLHGQPVAAAAHPEGTVAVFSGQALLGVADVGDGFARPQRVVAAPADGADPVESKALSAL